MYIAQKKIREARKAIEKIPCKQLDVDNNDDGKEFQFWFDLRRLCLLPEQAAFGQSQELKEKLSELRDTSLGVLVVVNVLWLTFMLTVMSQGKKLQVAGTDFASVCFLFVYFVVRITYSCSAGADGLFVVVVVVVYFILSRLLYLAFSANLGLLFTCRIQAWDP